ncbi:MAG: KTSC domain-containing protein [Pyrinomonadaceae bacterium]
MIEMNPVADSYHVTAAGYDAATQTLAVRLRDGSMFEYPNVLPKMWEQLILDRFNTLFEYHFKNKNRTGAKRIVPEENSALAGLTGGARVAEMRTLREFGEKGTPTRAEFEKLKAQLDALSTAKLTAEIQRINAKLDSAGVASDAEEIAGLMARRAALLVMCNAARPKIARINEQMESVRKSYARSQELKLKKQKFEGATYSGAHARLAELTRLLANPYAPSFTDGMEMQRLKTSGQSVTDARRQAREVWEKEQDRLCDLLGFPPVDRSGKKLAFVNNAG